ncbi:MAG: ASCH domain-containing protein [Acidobacteriota bacterium]|nr:ASCH domain-containing protein [Acidobacteriota bacterium]
MNKSKMVQEFWQKFCAENPEVNRNTPYEVWFFHHNREPSKKLAELVVSGRKQATASLMEYENDTGEGGTVGGYSVVTDFDGNPQCVIQTTEVRALPFGEVDAKFAFDEGEGDRTLEYWRAAHTEFFTECCRELNIEFNESMMICCKRFKKLFPKL